MAKRLRHPHPDVGPTGHNVRERDMGEGRDKRCGVFPPAAEGATSSIPLPIGYSDLMARQAVSGVPEHRSLAAWRDVDWREGLLDRVVVVMGRHRVLRQRYRKRKGS